MSINFYWELNDCTPLTTLTYDFINKFANERFLLQTDNCLSHTFQMTWKMFLNMIRESFAWNKINTRPKFVKLLDSPEYRISLLIPIQNRPLMLSSESGMNLITPDAVQSPDETIIQIIFTRRKYECKCIIESFSPNLNSNFNSIENFSGTNYFIDDFSFMDYLLIIIALLLIIYLAYWIHKRR